MMKILAAASALVLAVGSAGSADAAVVVDVVQAGTAVTMTATGTLNLTGLTTFNINGTSGIAVRAAPAFLGVGTTGLRLAGYQGFTGPANVGSSTTYREAASGTGSVFALNSRSFGDTPTIFVASGYLSGAAIDGRATFNNATIASLGLTAGQYVYRSANDTVTINVAGQVAAVPEPATWGLMLSGFFMVGAGLRSRRRSPVFYA